MCDAFLFQLVLLWDLYVKVVPFYDRNRLAEGAADYARDPRGNDGRARHDHHHQRPPRCFARAATPIYFSFWNIYTLVYLLSPPRCRQRPKVSAFYAFLMLSLHARAAASSEWKARALSLSGVIKPTIINKYVCYARHVEWYDAVWFCTL